MDLAIGVIIGAAFQAIVTSLTGDIISPLLGLFGQVNFDSLAITVGQATIPVRRVPDGGAELYHYGAGDFPVCKADQ